MEWLELIKNTQSATPQETQPKRNQATLVIFRVSHSFLGLKILLTQVLSTLTKMVLDLWAQTEMVNVLSERVFT